MLDERFLTLDFFVEFLEKKLKKAEVNLFLNRSGIIHFLANYLTK